MSNQPVIVAVADVHLGNHRRMGGPVDASINRRCRLVLDVLRTAVRRAVELNAAAFVVLGDLFDDDHPTPQLVTEVQAIFAHAERAGVMVILLVGNHDQTSAGPKDHALGPLAPYALVVSAPQTAVVRGLAELGLIPFMPGSAGGWVEEAARALVWRTTGAPRALCVHAGVRDSKTAPWLQDARDAIDAATLVKLAREVSAGVVLAGNYHNRRSWGLDASGEVVETFLGEGRQGGSVASDIEDALLAMDGGTEERVWPLHGGLESAVPAHSSLRRNARSGAGGASARSPMPEQGLREPGASRAGDAAGEPASRRGLLREERAQDELPEGARVLAREHVSSQERTQALPDVHARGATPSSVDVLQVGALCPTGWSDSGIDGYGGLAILGADGSVRFESLPGPRFVKVVSEADLKLQLAFAERRGALLHVQWEASPYQLADATSKLVTLIEQGRIVAGEVVAGAAQAAEKAQAAATAARSAGSLEEALGAYVTEMDLPVGVERDDVLARSRRYLGV